MKNLPGFAALQNTVKTLNQTKTVFFSALVRTEAKIYISSCRNYARINNENLCLMSILWDNVHKLVKRKKTKLVTIESKIQSLLFFKGHACNRVYLPLFEIQ